MMSRFVAADCGSGAAVCGSDDWSGARISTDGVAASPVIESLIREGARLKKEIESKTARLRGINAALAESAEFKGDRKTAHLVGAGYHVTVKLHDNITWDQERLCRFREFLPEEKFAQLFRTVYEPASKKQIDGFIAHADPGLASALQSCMNVRPGAPQVSYAQNTTDASNR